MTPMTPISRSSLNGGSTENQDDVQLSGSPPTPVTPMRRQTALPAGTSQTVLLRRASPWHRAVIDDYLIFSEEIGLARMSNDSRSTAPSSPKPISSTVRNRLSIRDASVLKRRRSYVELQNFGGHSRTESTSKKDDHRASHTPTSSKRASFAGSIKRGLSLSLNDGPNDPWGSYPVSTTSLLVSPQISAIPISIPHSPVRLLEPALANETEDERHSVGSQGDMLTQRHIRSRSQGLPSQRAGATAQLPITTLPRKQSLTRLGSLFGRSKADGSHSLPSSPSGNSFPRATRPGTGQNTPLEQDPTGSGYFGDQHHPNVFPFGAGITNIRPDNPSRPSFLSRSMSFAKSKGKPPSSQYNTSESGGLDSRRCSMDVDALFSSVNTTPSEPARGLESVPGSPTKVPEPLIDSVTTETSSSTRESRGQRSRTPSETGTDASGLSASDRINRRPPITEDNQPKRRRSVRFFSSIKGLTSITGNTSQA
jgi:hypothetical protein